MMIKLLSYFIINKHTPHIVLPIGTFNTDISIFTDLIKDDFIDKSNEKYNEFVENYKNNAYYNEVSILISEWANRGDLLDFIRKNYKKFEPKHWKVIFFQIISVLAIIQSKFPAFRHNDLKANNILVHKIEKKTGKSKYNIVGTTYKVPNIGYHIKLWDFDFACIPGIIDNEKVSQTWAKSINIVPEQNKYYDMHYFFNTLIKKSFFPQFLTDNHIPKETQDFLARIVPKELRSGVNVHKRGRILLKDEILLPENVLKLDPYFEEFRNNKKKIYSNTPDSKKLLKNNDILDMNEIMKLLN